MEHIIEQDKLLNELKDYVILRGYRGSVAHDMFQEDIIHDDKDIMGIFVPPEDSVFGLHKTETIERMVDEKLSQKKIVTWDIVYYSLPKYLNLVLKQNPNVLCMLWLEERHYINRTKFGNKLIMHRDKMLSKQCYQSFSGYAYGQLHRMTHHTPTGKMGAKRKELIAQFGYDVKNAAHLIRLLKMGIEALVLGKLIIARPDNNQLLEIKRGEWKLEKVLKYSDELFSRMEDAFVRSRLPDKVDAEFVNNLCKWIIVNYYQVPLALEIY